MIKRAMLIMAVLAMPVAQAAGNHSGPLSEFAAKSSDAGLAPLAALFGSMGGYFAGGTGVLAGAIKSINLFFFALAAIVVAWSIISASIRSAHTGRFLGGDQSNAWAPMRMVIGGALLVPAFGGFSLANLIVAWAITVGVGLGNIVFSGGATLVQKTTGSPVVAPAVSDSQSLARTLLDAAICARGHNFNMKRLRDAGLDDQMRKDPWTVDWTPTLRGDDKVLRIEYGECGGAAIAWPTRTDALPAAVYDRLRDDQTQAALQLANTIWAITSTTSPTAEDITQLETAADTYRDSLEQRWKTSVAGLQDTIQSHMIKAVGNTSWLGAGGIVTGTAAAASSGSAAAGASKPIAPQKGSDPAAWMDGQSNVPLSWSNAMDKTGSWFSNKWNATKNVVGSAVDFMTSGASISSAISSWIDDQSRSLARSIAETAPRARVGELGNGAGGIAGLAAFGSNVVAWCSSALVAWTGLSAIIGTAQGTGVAAVTAAGGLISNLLTSLMALGTMLSAWLPFLPSLFWGFAVVGFLFSAVTAMLASPIWGIMHLDLNGDGLVNHGTRSGYLMLLNLICRPALLVVFALAATVLFDWSLAFVGGMVQAAIQSAISSGSGIQALVAAIGGTFFYLTAGLLLAVYVFGYVLQGPDAVLAIAGGAFSNPHAPMGAGTPSGDPVGGALGGAADRAGQRGGDGSRPPPGELTAPPKSGASVSPGPATATPK